MILSFINDDDVIAATRKVITVITAARNRPESQIFKNAVDPFSGLFDAAVQGIEIEEWLSQEKSRQIQKTFQNAIGNFHQSIIGSMHGWENLGIGGMMDVRSQTKKIVAEIKNKYNTTKGDHRPRVYDDIAYALSQENNSGFTGYLVEIIPKNKKECDKLFCPSDNTTHIRRPENEKIRIISGQLFYDIASGEKHTLKRLYMVLPEIIADITNTHLKEITGNMSPEYLFDKAF